MPKTKPTSSSAMICNNCGSANVTCAATAFFNPNTQQWELESATPANLTCRDCQIGDQGFTAQPPQTPEDLVHVPASIIAHLQTFLATRGKSTGGWAEVRPEDLAQLNAVLQAILHAKYEADPDGDRPVEWRLVNRNVCERLGFLNTLYSADIACKDAGALGELARKDPVAYERRRMRDAYTNLDMAVTQLRRVHNAHEWATEEADRKSEHPPLIYLAGAYSHDPEEAYRAAASAATTLHKRSTHVFSPILHNHSLAEAVGRGWEHWGAVDTHMLDLADELWILEDPKGAWKVSRGVRAEIAHAKKTDKPIRYLAHDPFTGKPADTPHS